MDHSCLAPKLEGPTPLRYEPVATGDVIFPLAEFVSLGRRAFQVADALLNVPRIRRTILAELLDADPALVT